MALQSLSSHILRAEDYDFPTLRRYIALFPESPRSRLIRAYMLYMGSWVEEEEEEKDDEGYDGPVPDKEEEEPLDIMLVCYLLVAVYQDVELMRNPPKDAFNALSSSILAHRIVSEVYLWELDYANVIAIAEVGMELTRAHTKDTGISLKLCVFNKSSHDFTPIDINYT